MEYCNGGDLEKLKRNRGGKLSEKEALIILSEICEAFKNM
jgi:serine/threonine protein kinase